MKFVILKRLTEKSIRIFFSNSAAFSVLAGMLFCSGPDDRETVRTGISEIEYDHGIHEIQASAMASEESIAAGRRAGMTASSCDAAKVLLENHLRENSIPKNSYRILETVVIEKGKYCRLRALNQKYWNQERLNSDH